MPELFQLYATIKGDTAQLEKDIARARKTVQGLRKDIDSLGSASPSTSGIGRTGAELDGLAQKARNFSTSFNKSIRDLSTDNLVRSSQQLSRAFLESTRSGLGFEQTIKRFTPEVNRLSTALKKGSADQADYNRRFAQLSPDVQRAIVATRTFGKEVQEAGAKAKASPLFSGSFRGGLLGGLIGGGAIGVITGLGYEFKQLAQDGIKLNASLDKLIRFTSTLDKNFQTPEGLKRFRADIEKLSTEIPQSATDIAKASFTLKSAFQNISEPELINFLREFGLAATASNTTIDKHADNVAALAKQYGVTAKDLRGFSAMIASSFGQALASDTKVAEGFNKILNAAKSTKQPLGDLIAAMSTLQSASSDAEQNTTLLHNVLSKITDPKYIEGFKGIGVEVFGADKNFRSLNDIINDVAKSMEGLSDADINKKFAFLRDQQAREGFLTLARLAKDYNKALAEGGDTQSFANKTKVMLDSTEARWIKFYANIENAQRGFGARISDSILSIFDQQTGRASVQVFFNNLIEEIQIGVVAMAESVSQLPRGLGNWIAEGLGLVSPTGIAGIDRQINEWFAGIRNSIRERGAENRLAIQQEQVEFFRSILASPNASAQLKESAKKSLDALTEGMQEGTKTATDAIAQSGTELKSSLEKLSQNTNLSENLRNKLKEEIKRVGDGVKEGTGDAKTKIAASSKDLQDALSKLLGDARISGGLKEKIKQEIAGLQQGINEAKPSLQKSGADIGNVFLDASNKSIQAGRASVVSSTNSLFQNTNAGATAKSTGFSIGTNIWTGMVAGIKSGYVAVGNAAAGLGSVASSAAKSALQSQSPSKVFFAIGADTTQGFVDGITATSPKVSAALQKSITKQVAELKKELKTITSETDATLGGFGQIFKIKAEIADKNKLKSDLEEIFNLRRELGLNIDKPLIIGDIGAEITRLTSLREKVSDISGSVSEILKKDDNALKNLFDTFANPETTKLIQERAKALGLTAEQFKNIAINAERARSIAELAKPITPPDFDRGGEITNSGIGELPTDELYEAAPRIKAVWEDFFTTFRDRLAQIKSELPSFKAILGDSFIGAIDAISSTFATAATSWITTGESFFSSIAKGFAQMAQQIISELIRIAMVKLITQALGSVFGGGSGGGGVLGSALGHVGGGHSFASGGAVSGRGTGTSDSIAAWLSNGEFVNRAKSVAFYGRDFFEKLNNLQIPKMALAGGGGYGYMPSTSSHSTIDKSQFHQPVTIYVQGGNEQQNIASARQIKRELMRAQQAEYRRNK